MNNYKLALSIVGLFVATLVYSQTYEDVLRYSQPQFSGTARSISMGGAFGSLGGDFSALSINPAGIATYRSSEFSFTPSMILNSTKSSYLNTTAEDNKTTLAFNQIGFVGTYRPMREVKKGIVSTHFAIGYNRNSNFNYRSMALAQNVSNSMSDMFVINANGHPSNELTGLTELAFNSFIIDYSDENTNQYTNFLFQGDLTDQTRIIEKDGYFGEINLTGGANISNFILIGGSLNFAMLNYKENSNYFELYNQNNESPAYDVFKRFTVNNYLNAAGNGVNLKFGIIIKPTKSLRVGLAYHTPTWYNIEEDFGSKIKGLFFNDIASINTNETYAYSNGKYDYNFNTPDKYVTSASYTFGKTAILSFDYEYINYANAQFKSSSDSYDDISFINDQNIMIKQIFASANNYRIGAEFRVNNQFSLRSGYSFQESPYKSSPKDNEIICYSAGIGYRNRNYFVDMAYKYSTFDINYFNYNWDPGFDSKYGTPSIVKTESKDHNIVLTLGWKF